MMVMAFLLKKILPYGLLIIVGMIILTIIYFAIVLFFIGEFRYGTANYQDNGKIVVEVKEEKWLNRVMPTPKATLYLRVRNWSYDTCDISLTQNLKKINEGKIMPQEEQIFLLNQKDFVQINICQSSEVVTFSN